MFLPDFSRFEPLHTTPSLTARQIEVHLHGLTETLRPLTSGMLGGQFVDRSLCEPFLAKGHALAEVGFRRLVDRNPGRARKWLAHGHGVPLPVEAWSSLVAAAPTPRPAPLDALPPRLQIAIEQLLRAVEAFPQQHRLNPPASDEQIDDAEEAGKTSGPYPAEFRALWRIANGAWLFGGEICLMSAEELSAIPRFILEGMQATPLFDLVRSGTLARSGPAGEEVWRFHPHVPTKKRVISAPIARTLATLLPMVLGWGHPETGEFTGMRLPRGRRPLPPED